MPETRVPVATLKARLSEYLRRVKAGETVVVTDRGTPVARLVPLEGAVALEGRIEVLAEAGLVRRPTRRPLGSLRERDRPKDPDGRSLEAILEERAEGW